MTRALEPVRVGVWGVGVWGEKHARIYAGLESADLVGVFDADADRAEQVAAQYETRAFPSAAALLEACEAVSIAVPTTEHRRALEQAAGTGRHALVEKPLASTLSDADAMIAAVRRHGTTLQVGQVERFNPALRAVRSIVQGVKFVEAHRMALFQPRSLDIDVVFDLMIHDLDVVLDVVGLTPSQVSAVGVAVLSSNEDIANARLEFPNGCVANLTASRVSQERLRRIRFFQDDAYVSVDLFAKRCDVLRLDPALRRGDIVHPLQRAAAIRREDVTVEDHEPLGLELDAFVRSLRGSGSGAASAEAGRAALAVAEAVRSEMKQRSRQWAAGQRCVS